MTHKGTLVQDLDDMVTRREIERRLFESYSAEQICQIIADIPPAELPHCESCEKPTGLFPCKDCHTFYCSDCKASHAHNSGPDAGQGRF